MLRCDEASREEAAGAPGTFRDGAATSTSTGARAMPQHVAQAEHIGDLAATVRHVEAKRISTRQPNHPP